VSRGRRLLETRGKRLSEGKTFAALAVPNYRRYVSGQSLSLIGTWCQMTGQSWLVLSLTHSATALGVIVALQTLPVLILGPYAGLVADRSNKRRLNIVLQAMMGVQALVLGVLTVAGAVRIWEIGLLALVLGLNNAFENPVRQSFMLEMVGGEHLRNAVSLNSTMQALARVIGPATAGLLIAIFGSGVCFLINAASFIPVLLSLTRLDTTALHPVAPTPRGRGQLREGFAYVRRTPDLAVPLVMIAVVGCLTYEYQVSLPYMASRGLHAGSSGFGFMTAAMAIGSVLAGLVIAARGRTGTRGLVIAAAGYGVLLTFATLAPNLPLELFALMLAGGTSVSFMSTGNATMQLASAPEMRGRVMALWFVGFQGSTPIGAPIVGAVMATFGPRSGLGLGAATCFVAAAGGALALHTLARPRRPEAIMVR
jgi:MFS family permease